MRLLVIFILGFLFLFIGLLFIVGMRLFGVGGVGFVRTLWSGLIDGCVQIWFLPLPFCGVTLVLLLVGLGFWPVLIGLMRNSVKRGFPIVARSGQMEASLGGIQ